MMLSDEVLSTHMQDGVLWEQWVMETLTGLRVRLAASHDRAPWGH